MQANSKHSGIDNVKVECSEHQYIEVCFTEEKWKIYLHFFVKLTVDTLETICNQNIDVSDVDVIDFKDVSMCFDGNKLWC